MFQKQPMMRRVLYALAPIAALSVWLYGPRVVLTLAVSLGVGILVEYLFEKKKGGKVFATMRELNLSHLRQSYGAGIRLKSPRKVKLRLDVLHSPEGTRVQVKLGPSF